MPTVFRQDVFRFFFYSNEGDPHESVHIHVMKDGAEAKVWLGPPVVLGRSAGFDARTLRRLIRLITARAGEIKGARHDHFSN